MRSSSAEKEVAIVVTFQTPFKRTNCFLWRIFVNMCVIFPVLKLTSSYLLSCLNIILLSPPPFTGFTKTEMEEAI